MVFFSSALKGIAAKMLLQSVSCGEPRSAYVRVCVRVCTHARANERAGNLKIGLPNTIHDTT
jgi:hypothetical protein